MWASTVRIELHARLNPTENRGKLRSAIGNIIDFKSNLVDLSSEEFLAFTSEDINSLKPLYEKLREQKILEAARSFFLNIKSPQFLMFHLNRQAAYVNRVHLCAEERESPLGPITVIVHSKNIEKFIDWLTPPTFKGRPINLDKEQLSLEDL
ncbi:MAG: hypothetical protein OdinLCB4_002020 [Candidatus Odinarchaeum yellowstonii]|uniref:UPF0201 protein OdinLCB4_002020 n=1 Tax=Odinarchaeota yellowstonii (strain LCB_4) TaxID=1841599 RepID=A0AAF0D2Z5_ODILC|nr:MAG: hypothetical protein OdinLCB4_002020 [Candidatus Odinarchaeum yellowstonii]